jgi:uncharacterized membrane protein YccC
MSDSIDRYGALKRALAYAVFPAVVAATFWQSGYVAMLGIFVLLLPFEVALFWICRRIAHMRDKRDARGARLDLR